MALTTLVVVAALSMSCSSAYITSNETTFFNGDAVFIPRGQIHVDSKNELLLMLMLAPICFVLFISLV